MVLWCDTFKKMFHAVYKVISIPESCISIHNNEFAKNNFRWSVSCRFVGLFNTPLVFNDNLFFIPVYEIFFLICEYTVEQGEKNGDLMECWVPVSVMCP